MEKMKKIIRRNQYENARCTISTENEKQTSSVHMHTLRLVIAEAAVNGA